MCVDSFFVTLPLGHKGRHHSRVSAEPELHVTASIGPVDMSADNLSHAHLSCKLLVILHLDASSCLASDASLW